MMRENQEEAERRLTWSGTCLKRRNLRGKTQGDEEFSRELRNCTQHKMGKKNQIGTNGFASQ
jgi:hypothetical protein